MHKKFEQDGLEIDYVISKDFQKDPQVFKNQAVKNFSLKKDNSQDQLIFAEGFDTNKEILKEVNDLGSLNLLYHFYSDVGKKLVKIESLQAEQTAKSHPEPNSQEEEEEILKILDIDNFLKEQTKK